MKFRCRWLHRAVPVALLWGVIGWAPAEVRSYVTEIPALLAASPASDWLAIADEDIVVLELASGTVFVKLSPLTAPARVAQWRALIEADYFDASSVQRVQENYVVQWGEASGSRSPGKAGARLADETTFPFTAELAQRFVPLQSVDSYAPNVGFVDGIAIGLDKQRQRAWALQCHGAVGTVQADPATSAGGVYYYASIGNPTRELDGKIAVVGQVIEGIDAMTTLSRGEGVYGYLDDGKHVPILRTRLASALPDNQRPRFEWLRTDSATFAALLQLRGATLTRTTADAPAAYSLDACSVPLPVRRIQGHG